MTPRWKSALGWVAVSVISPIIAAVLVAGWGLLAYGSVYALPALAQGKVVYAQPALRSLGELQAGRRYKVAFTVRNLSNQPVSVNGMRTNCGCISAADDFPLEIPPHGQRPLRLWVQPVPSQAGQTIFQTALLHLSVPSPRVILSVRGTVSEPSSDSDSDVTMTP